MKFTFLTFLAALAGTATANPEQVLEYDLIAGQIIEVGKLTITSEIAGDFCNILEVEYTTTDTEGSAWLITETHLHIGTDIPQTKKGNPKVGKFEYHSRDDDGVSTVTYSAGGGLLEGVVPCGDTTLIAAHAVVTPYLLGLPDPIATEGAQNTFSVTEDGNIGGSEPSYFDVAIDGVVYDGWCVDTDHTIDYNTVYSALVYRIDDPNLPDAALDWGGADGNLDLVTWIINQHFTTQTSVCTGSTAAPYTYGDIQLAIWTLIEGPDGLSTAGLGAYEQCRVDEIVARAQSEGEGFVPGCNDYMAVILVPVDATAQEIIPTQVIIAQVILAQVELSCRDISDETAWGWGDIHSEGRNWAKYIEYECPPCERRLRSA